MTGIENYTISLGKVRVNYTKENSFKSMSRKKCIVFTDNKVRNFLVSTRRSSYFTISTHVGIFSTLEGCASRFFTREIFTNTKRTPIFISFSNQNFTQTYSILIAIDHLSCWNSSAFSWEKQKKKKEMQK